jgi:hypothetical protein
VLVLSVISLVSDSAPLWLVGLAADLRFLDLHFSFSLGSCSVCVFRCSPFSVLCFVGVEGEGGAATLGFWDGRIWVLAWFLFFDLLGSGFFGFRRRLWYFGGFCNGYVGCCVGGFTRW